MSPQEKKKNMLKYQPKEEKKILNFIKINQMTGINTQFSVNLWILVVLFLPIKRQTSRLDQKSRDNPGLERQMLPHVFRPVWVLALCFLDFHVSYGTSAELRKQEWILKREGEEVLMDEKIAEHVSDEGGGGRNTGG